MHLLVASEIYNVYEVLFYKHSSIYTSYTLEIVMAQEGGNCLPRKRSNILFMSNKSAVKELFGIHSFDVIFNDTTNVDHRGPGLYFVIFCWCSRHLN